MKKKKQIKKKKTIVIKAKIKKITSPKTKTKVKKDGNIKTDWEKTEAFNWLIGKTLTAIDKNGIGVSGKITEADSICTDSYWGKMVLVKIEDEHEGHGFLVNINETNKKNKVITNYKCRLNNCTIKIEN